jgi:hypothetical protein
MRDLAVTEKPEELQNFIEKDGARTRARRCIVSDSPESLSPVSTRMDPINDIALEAGLMGSSKFSVGILRSHETDFPAIHCHALIQYRDCSETVVKPDRKRTHTGPVVKVLALL